MKKIFLLITMSLAIMISNAQINEGGEPKSKGLAVKSLSKINTYKAKRLNINKALKEDENAPKGVAIRYAILDTVSIDIKQQGTKYNLNEGTLYLYKIKAKNALSIGLIFSAYKVPKGATLFLYNADYSQIQGAYTYKNNKKHNMFAIADFKGNELVIEYFEPNNAEFKGNVVLGSIGKAYRNIFKSSNAKGDVELIGINCPEGDAYQLEKHAVAKMTFGGLMCSGALINNTENDGKSYFLTANHCISTQTKAEVLITYFNYENPYCNSGAINHLTLSGSTLKATSDYTDVTLLELDDKPTADYQPYYAGWNAKATQEVPSGFGIHHPEGLPKKLSISYNKIVNNPEVIVWQGGIESVVNTHWLVYFDRGQTLGGSSGSPLFDDKGLIIGQLHGGSVIDNFYGKLSVSWPYLKKYLDPNNTGKLILNGYIPSDNLIDPFLYADYRDICKGEPLQLHNGTLFGGDTYKWTITPDSYKFVEGSSEISENPKVVFDKSGRYDVSLDVTKDGKKYSVKRKNYLSANGLKMKIDEPILKHNCVSDFEQQYIVNGAENINAEIVKGGEVFEIDKAKTKGNFVFVKVKDNYDLEDYTEGQVKITGTVGECSDEVIKTLDASIINNDNIKNALPLKLGYNGLFDNECATAQPNEPHPPVGSDKCTTPGYWCNCPDASKPEINHSLWFTFVATKSGVVKIRAKAHVIPNQYIGLDTKIAVYEADNAEDIMSGDKSKYKIIAASDDYKEDQPMSYIKNLKVKTNKKYWLQVDGSACGAVGQFYITFVEKDGEATALEGENAVDNNIVVYPNPATEYFTIKQPNVLEDVLVELISVDGKVVNQYEEEILNPNAEYQFGIPATAKGMHTINVKEGNKIIFSKKIMIE